MTEELAKIYHHICTANNITPSRVMLEHSKGERLVVLAENIPYGVISRLRWTSMCSVTHILYLNIHTSQLWD